MTTFNDIFKNKFLEQFTSASTPSMILSMAFALLIGLFIFYIYKSTYKGVMYSRSFGITLIALTLISTLVILAVSTNVVLSLGMVGALSIVRFRSAIKDPMDLSYLFWSIAGGIVLAAGMYLLAIFASVVIGAVLVIFARFRPHDEPYILVLSCDGAEAEANANAALAKNVKKYVVKSKSASTGNIELNYEIRLRSGDTSFLNELAEMKGVRNTVLVSYNGDYTG
jgi:uncharacterized membrane protein YhiD involved in acid resistance